MKNNEIIKEDNEIEVKKNDSNKIQRLVFVLCIVVICLVTFFYYR